jgi:ATP-dependent helicase/nuclease subunit A
VPEDTVRRMDDEVVQILTETLHEHTQRLGEDERDRVVGFFREAIIDDLLESDLWTRLQTAETVQVEKPISGLVTVQDIQMELHGEADFVIQTPSGEQHVVDIKIALADPTNETQKRYQLQIAAYAYLFDQVSTSTDLVRPTVETFGVKRRTTVSEWTPEIVERRLAVLLKKTRNST